MGSIFLYDISNNKVRTKVARLLLQAGYCRIQKSVFLGKADTQFAIQLFSETQDILNGSRDSNDRILIIPVPERCLDSILSVGRKPDMDFILRRLHTLIV